MIPVSFREVTEVGEALEKLQEVTGSVTCARAAVLYDRENDWALKDAQGPRNEDMHYQECVLKQYRALRAEGLDVDVISMEHALSDYKILAVPMAYLSVRNTKNVSESMWHREELWY